MSDENQEVQAVVEESATASSQTAYAVEFPPPQVGQQSQTIPLQRFYDVSVTVSVELGRVTMPIGEMLKLGESAVIELNRDISEEVDIMAQGVCIAKGEVVVVDDRFAVRITQLVDSDKDSSKE